MLLSDCVYIMMSDRLKRNLKRNNKLFFIQRVDLVLEPHHLAASPGAGPVPFSLFRLLEAKSELLSALIEPGVPLLPGGDVLW